VVGGRVAHAVARGLDGVHLDPGELGKDVWHVVERGPVELEVLAGGEVAEAAVVAVGDERQRPQLRAGQHPVGDGHPQHVGVSLEVEPVAEP
jgi:hypothetical protein